MGFRLSAGPTYDRTVLDLVLIRHGQSAWNAENLFTGWVDVDLTVAGEDEARAGGELLARRPPRPTPASRSWTCAFCTHRC